MEYRHEQTVSAAPDRKNDVLLALAWTGIILLALLAIVFAAGIIGADADGGISINWVGALLTLLCFAAAFGLWRVKDGLRIEYDYAISEGRLEVTAVMNNRRRKQRLSLEIGRIIACGQGQPPRQVSAEKLCLNTDAVLTYVCYEDKGSKKCALLELNEDMTALLKNSRELQRGAWRG